MQLLFFLQNAVQTDNKVLQENRSKFVLLHSSSGFKHSLRGKSTLFFC